MAIKKVVFTCKNMLRNDFNFGVLDRLDIIFERSRAKPIVLIESGEVKIEDRGFEIDSKEVLDNIGKIDFGKLYDKNIPSCFTRNSWELVIDDKKYEGALYYLKRTIELNDEDIYAHFYIGNILKELGDIAWYLAEAATALDMDLEDILQANIEKLKKRYPEGFSSERSRIRLEGDL